MKLVALSKTILISVDMVSEEMEVTVLHQPYFTSGDEILWGWNEEVVNISCENESNPPGKVTLM